MLGIIEQVIVLIGVLLVIVSAMIIGTIIAKYKFRKNQIKNGKYRRK